MGARAARARRRRRGGVDGPQDGPGDRPEHGIGERGEMTPMEIPAGLGRVLVIIPTYNERDNIERIAARVREAVPEADVLVVDDASPDGTGEVADAMAAGDEQVKVLHREGKEGLGPAYIAGFRWAAEHGYDVMVEMDADGSHQPEELPRLLSALEDADLVIGARWVPGGKVRNWPKRREALSRGANTYARLMLGIHLHDATAGYRAFRAATLDKIGLDEVDSRGYCFQIDLALRAVRQGLRVVEVPITFVEREHGTSKMSRDVMAEAALRITQWGVSDRVGKNRPPR
nr:polyprenol monophosphomannose synthase [Actinomadura madurae]